MILAYVPFFVGALLIHELGHLAAARACGVEVNEIGLGWGLKLAEFRWHNVNWAIRILPVGAYVRLDLDELQRRPLAQQILIFLAGIVANLVAAALAGGTRLGAMNFLLAATNILPFYQQDGWKCGMVMLRGLLSRKSALVEWIFTVVGTGLSIAVFTALAVRLSQTH